jgi:hypothetical protein
MTYYDVLDDTCAFSSQVTSAMALSLLRPKTACWGRRSLERLLALAVVVCRRVWMTQPTQSARGASNEQNRASYSLAAGFLVLSHSRRLESCPSTGTSTRPRSGPRAIDHPLFSVHDRAVGSGRKEHFAATRSVLSGFSLLLARSLGWSASDLHLDWAGQSLTIWGHAPLSY